MELSELEPPEEIPSDDVGASLEPEDPDLPPDEFEILAVIGLLSVWVLSAIG